MANSVFNQYKYDRVLPLTQFARNGHDPIESGFDSGYTGRTYFWIEVVGTTAATITYADGAGQSHVSASCEVGEAFDCSGVPTVHTGAIRAFIDQFGEAG